MIDDRTDSFGLSNPTLKRKTRIKTLLYRLCTLSHKSSFGSIVRPGHVATFTDSGGGANEAYQSTTKKISAHSKLRRVTAWVASTRGTSGELAGRTSLVTLRLSCGSAADCCGDCRLQLMGRVQEEHDINVMAYPL